MNTLSTVIIALYMQFSAIDPEIGGLKNLPTFSVAPLTTHFVLRDRGYGGASNSIRILDLGIYGWSAFRINESYKKFESLSKHDQISVWNSYLDLRKLVDDDINHITPFSSTSEFNVLSNYSLTTNAQLPLQPETGSDLIRSIRGFEFIFAIEAFRLKNCSNMSKLLLNEFSFHNWRKHTSCKNSLWTR